jgi:hypothetical protein
MRFALDDRYSSESYRLVLYHTMVCMCASWDRGNMQPKVYDTWLLSSRLAEPVARQKHPCFPVLVKLEEWRRS